MTHYFLSFVVPLFDFSTSKLTHVSARSWLNRPCACKETTNNLSNILKYVILADDNNMFCSDDCLQWLMEKMTVQLGQLKLWFDVNKLSLNE